MIPTIELPDFAPVAAGKKAILHLPRGLTYHDITFTRGGTTFNHDHMELVRVLANGKPILEMTGAEWDDFNAHDGLATGDNVTGVSVLSFERPGLLLPNQVMATVLRTGKPPQANPKADNYNPSPIKKLTIEVTIAAGAVAPELSAKARVSPGDVTGVFIKRRKFPGYSYAGAGDYEISDLNVGDPVNRIWLYGANGNINEVEVWRDRVSLFKRTKEENQFIQGNGVKAPVGNTWFCIDPTEFGIGNDPLGTDSEDFRLKLSLGGAEDVIVFMDYLGDLRGN